MDIELVAAAQLLQFYFDVYDQLLFLKSRELLKKLYQTEILHRIKSHLVVLAQEEYVVQTANVSFVQVDGEMAEAIENLYYTYQFSSKFIFISEECGNYASIFNLVRTGLLSEEEVFETFLTDCVNISGE